MGVVVVVVVAVVLVVAAAAVTAVAVVAVAVAAVAAVAVAAAVAAVAAAPVVSWQRRRRQCRQWRYSHQENVEVVLRSPYLDEREGPWLCVSQHAQESSRVRPLADPRRRSRPRSGAGSTWQSRGEKYARVCSTVTGT